MKKLKSMFASGVFLIAMLLSFSPLSVSANGVECETKVYENVVENAKNRFLARGCKTKCEFWCTINGDWPDLVIKVK